MTAEKKANKTFFADGISTNFEAMKWEKPGDSVRGILVGKYTTEQAKYKSNETEMVEKYLILNAETKEIVKVYGRKTGADSVKRMNGMDIIRVGNSCSIEFLEEVATASGNAWKKISVRVLPPHAEAASILDEFQSLIDLTTLTEESEEEVGSVKETKLEF